MSNIVSALNGATAVGYVQVAETGPLGMITLRCKHSEPALAGALAALTLDMPGQTGITHGRDRACGWMSPDEVLIILPYAEVAQALTVLEAKLAGVHHLAVDVSDARAVFTVTGSAAREIMAKLCPVDLAPGKFGPGQLRRTRLAQVAAAIWMVDATTFQIVCFRSVAQYVFDLLLVSCKPGSEIGLFDGVGA